ncbi:MAG: WecB/TagA/CpsF family glycosyltransferase [Tannerellaceae bacterium]|nr:WecB/TagA/CpsF family glycosyltransferase [Tannerellaceae bacterium]
MKKYFNVFLEFDKDIIHSTIHNAVKQDLKGYVCAIESNNLSIANKDIHFNKVVNEALVNVCDGSNIARFLGKLYDKNFTSYIGNDIFNYFIAQKTYTHYFLGNTEEILYKLKEQLIHIDPRVNNMPFESLPFKKVEDFDYKKIATKINRQSPDLIWVSLGAPKQELFMYNLLPYLNRGVMFGVGAAFNYSAKTGPVKRAPQWMLNAKLEWLYRACEEPKKNIPRYWNFIKLLPSLIYQEKRLIRSTNQTKQL